MIKEYGGAEKYASKTAMKKHESKETPSKEKGEMGYPSNKAKFEEAMQKQWESRKPGDVAKPAVKGKLADALKRAKINR
jgi:hypothetical protein